MNGTEESSASEGRFSQARRLPVRPTISQLKTTNTETRSAVPVHSLFRWQRRTAGLERRRQANRIAPSLFPQPRLLCAPQIVMR